MEQHVLFFYTPIPLKSQQFKWQVLIIAALYNNLKQAQQLSYQLGVQTFSRFSKAKKFHAVVEKHRAARLLEEELMETTEAAETLRDFSPQQPSRGRRRGRREAATVPSPGKPQTRSFPSPAPLPYISRSLCVSECVRLCAVCECRRRRVKGEAIQRCNFLYATKLLFDFQGPEK